jgi:hypothetical protein
MYVQAEKKWHFEAKHFGDTSSLLKFYQRATTTMVAVHRYCDAETSGPK